LEREIARAVRESGGGLKSVKALGLELRSRRQVQISINLTDFTVTPLHVVFEHVRRQAHRRGIEIVGSELIGLIPERALEASKGHDLRWLVENIDDYGLERRILQASFTAASNSSSAPSKK
jgi:glutamate formiminotransferase